MEQIIFPRLGEQEREGQGGSAADVKLLHKMRQRRREGGNKGGRGEAEYAQMGR